MNAREGGPGRDTTAGRRTGQPSRHEPIGREDHGTDDVAAPTGRRAMPDSHAFVEREEPVVLDPAAAFALGQRGVLMRLSRPGHKRRRR